MADQTDRQQPQLGLWPLLFVLAKPQGIQYKEAINFYEDLTPPEETERIAFQSASFYSGKRLSKIGRPTKKERRDLDDFTENN